MSFHGPSASRSASAMDPLAPGSSIGILGGGQLGRMLAMAAARLGFRCHVYSDHSGPAFDVANDPMTKTIWVAAWDGVYRWSTDDAKPLRAGLESTPIGIVRAAGKRLFAGGPDGLWERIDNAWQKIEGHFATSLTDVEVADGALGNHSFDATSLMRSTQREL